MTDQGTELISQRVTADNTGDLDFCPPGKMSPASPKLAIDLGEDMTNNLNIDNGGFHDETGLLYDEEAIDETPEHARDDDPDEVDSPAPSPDVSDIGSEVVTEGNEAVSEGLSDPPPLDLSVDSSSQLMFSANSADPSGDLPDTTTSPLKSDMDRF